MPRKVIGKLTDHFSVSWCGYLHRYVCGGASDFPADHVGFGAFHSRIWAVLQHGHGSGNLVIHCTYCTLYISYIVQIINIAQCTLYILCIVDIAQCTLYILYVVHIVRPL